jgi:MFS family permease
VAGVIVFYSGSYKYIFLFSVLPYLLNLITILGYPEELNCSPGQPQGTRRHMRLTARSFFKVVFRRDVLKLINTTALHSAFLQAIKDYIQLVMVQIALLLPFLLDTDPESKNGVVIGILYFIIYLATSRASRHSSKIADKTGRNITLLTLLLGFVMGILSGIFYMQELWVLSLLAFTGIYIVENIRKPILTGYVADHTPNELMVSVISAQSLIKTIMTATLALAFGLIADHAGIGVSILSVSGFLVLGILVLIAQPYKKVS